MLIRRRLIPSALAVLVSMLAGLVAMPLTIGLLDAASAAASVPILCTCGHGADALCPMHHPQSASSPASHASHAPTKPRPTNRCCAGCHDNVEMTLTAMIGLAAPIVDRCLVARPDGTSASLLSYGEHPLDQVRPPLSPPPRG